jgi:hypothetical protein
MPANCAIAYRAGTTFGGAVMALHVHRALETRGHSRAQPDAGAFYLWSYGT